MKKLSSTAAIWLDFHIFLIDLVIFLFEISAACLLSLDIGESLKY